MTLHPPISRGSPQEGGVNEGSALGGSGVQPKNGHFARIGLIWCVKCGRKGGRKSGEERLAEETMDTTLKLHGLVADMQPRRRGCTGAVFGITGD